MEKDIKISNLKGLLIFLVVFGHLIEVYKDTFHYLYVFIYSFHMPLFILISGYLAKRIDRKKIFNFLLLYLIFETIFNSIMSVISGVLQTNFAIPYFHLWYLLSMITWYLLAFPLTKKKLNLTTKLIVLTVTLSISLFSRYIDIEGLNNYFLSYQRSLTFLFFFFLGFVLDTKDMKKVYSLIKNKIVICSASILAIMSLMLAANTEELELIFMGAFNVNTSGLSDSQYFVQITMGLFISVFMCFVIMNMITSRTSFLTRWGDNSLYIFIFHAFFVIPIKTFPAVLGGINTMLLLVILGALALFTTMLLSSDWFIRYAYKICNPYKTVNKFFSRKNVSVEQTVR